MPTKLSRDTSQEKTNEKHFHFHKDIFTTWTGWLWMWSANAGWVTRFYKCSPSTWYRLLSRIQENTNKIRIRIRFQIRIHKRCSFHFEEKTVNFWESPVTTDQTCTNVIMDRGVRYMYANSFKVLNLGEQRSFLTKNNLSSKTFKCALKSVSVICLIIFYNFLMYFTIFQWTLWLKVLKSSKSGPKRSIFTI